MKIILEVKIILAALSIFIVFSSTVLAQSKNEQNEKMLSQEEIQKMMQEMQKGMEDRDPESKEMMKKMGIGMPEMKNLEYAVSGDYEDTGPIPKLDNERILKARQTKLNSGNLADYIQRVHQAVSTKVTPEAVQTGTNSVKK